VVDVEVFLGVDVVVTGNEVVVVDVMVVVTGSRQFPNQPYFLHVAVVVMVTFEVEVKVEAAGVVLGSRHDHQPGCCTLVKTSCIKEWYSTDRLARGGSSSSLRGGRG
jgi:hypothetical protein